MTLQYCNSFGQYTQGYPGTGLMGDDFVAYSGSPYIGSIEAGRGYFRYAGGSTWAATRLLLPSEYTTLVVGFRLWMFDAPAAELIVSFYDNDSDMLHLYEDSSGHIVVVRGATTILTSTGTTAQGMDASWAVKMVFHDTNGSVYLYKNGSLDSYVTGVDTINAGSACDQMLFRAPPHSGWSDWGISDLWFDDSDVISGGKVTYDPCNDAGSSSDFTPNGESTNEECVDEYQPDDDTTFNESTTDTDKDSLAHTTSIDVQSGIVGIQVVARVRKSDANESAIKLGVKHGASTDESSEIGVGTSYKWISELFLVDPSTSLPWDPTELDEIETSYEHAVV